MRFSDDNDCDLIAFVVGGSGVVVPVNDDDDDDAKEYICRSS